MTLILWIAMLMGAAGLVTFYFISSSRLDERPTSYSTNLAKDALSGKIKKDTLVSSPVQTSPETPAEDGSIKKPIPQSDHSEKEPSLSSNTKIEAELSGTTDKASYSFPVDLFSFDIPSLPVEPIKEHAAITNLSPKSTQPIIYETSKANGKFARAQEITKGIIIGKRDTESDRADFYKLRPTGSTMIIRLEPSLKGDKRFFMVKIYDTNQRLLKEHSGKTGPLITL
ncbi:MAG: hypothetical protein SV375_05595, partial [Thermodesulfobacteriota bacterium]|nr:hypothetical protein [Thermodesulfobacteriota bacterium]